MTRGLPTGRGRPAGRSRGSGGLFLLQDRDLLLKFINSGFGYLMKLCVILHPHFKGIKPQGLILDFIAKVKNIYMSSILFLMQGCHGLEKI